MRRGLAVLGLVVGCGHVGMVPTDRTIGTAAQIDPLGTDVAKDGSWVVLSQDDALDSPPHASFWVTHRDEAIFGSKLFIGAQAGIDIGLHWVSPDDRHLVVEREGRLELVDVPAGRWLSLASADLEGIADPSLGDEHPVEASERLALNWSDERCFTDFSADGRMLLFFDPRDDGPRLVVHRVADGEQHALDPGPGVLSWAKLMPAGDAVAVGMTVFDAGPPAVEVALPYPFDEAPRCTRPESLPEGARHVTRVLGLDGQELGRRPGEYDPMGKGLVQPTSEEGFTWWRPDLDRDLAIPACRGFRFYVDPVTPRMLELCDIDKDVSATTLGRLRLEEFEQRVDLGPLEYDGGPSTEEGGFVPLKTSTGLVLFELETARSIALPVTEGYVAVVAGRRALIHRGRLPRRPHRARIDIVDLDSLATLETFRVRLYIGESGTGPGPLVILGGRVVDLEAAEVVGRVSTRPWSITPAGEVLLLDPATKQPPRDRMPRGPLRWFVPARK